MGLQCRWVFSEFFFENYVPLVSLAERFQPGREFPYTQNCLCFLFPQICFHVNHPSLFLFCHPWCNLCLSLFLFCHPWCNLCISLFLFCHPWCNMCLSLFLFCHPWCNLCLSLFLFLFLTRFIFMLTTRGATCVYTGSQHGHVAANSFCIRQ